MAASFDLGITSSLAVTAGLAFRCAKRQRKCDLRANSGEAEMEIMMASAGIDGIDVMV
jgi:hypothetical protein